MQVTGRGINEQGRRGRKQIAVEGGSSIVALMNRCIGEVVARRAVCGGREPKLNGVKLIAIQQYGIVINLRARRIPRDYRTIGVSLPLFAHQTGREINEI